MFSFWADDPVAISRLSKGTMDPSLSVSMLAWGFTSETLTPKRVFTPSLPK